ncbi:unnamed protein product [Auanema sp. JU1783]|nr:unnamed protein product [Auanema sp. JU1783]
MVARSKIDILYGLLGQHKKGTAEYRYFNSGDQFACTTIIKSMSIEVIGKGATKKIAREVSAERALSVVKQNLKNKSAISDSSPTKYVTCQNQEEKNNGGGVYLMHVNSWLQTYRRKPYYDVNNRKNDILLKMRMFVPELNIDVTFEGEAQTLQIAKQICGQQAYVHLTSNGFISQDQARIPSINVVDMKKTSRRIPFIQAKVTESALELLNKYLLTINKHPDKVPEDDASIVKPIELLPVNHFDPKSEIVSSKLACEGPCPNWNPWASCPISEGLWYNTTKETVSNILYRLEKRMVKNNNLPILAQKDKIIETIKNNQVTIIAGGTGSGKSTQVVQYLMEEFIDTGEGINFAAYVTEPRRIAAISLAKRVASERREKLGTSVGYCVRLDHSFPRPYGSVVFCTTGILLKRMHSGLKGISHIIIDEVHERSLETDFLLILVKKLIQEGSSIKVILMSASMDTSVFSSYYDDCPVIDVEGKVFPVETVFLEEILSKLCLTQNYPLQCLDEYIDKRVFHLPIQEANYVIEKIIMRILKGTPKGSILVFMPGWFEITQLKEILEKNPVISERGTIFPLHSSVTKEEQNKVFLPSTNLKIILSTNIAESSITIDDVSYVIDSCRQKEAQKHQNVIQLDTVWISKSSLIQRRGRAGRVKRGICFHLCTMDHFELLPDNSVPEILRLSLDNIILQIKALGIGEPADVLRMAIDPPQESNIDEAIMSLRTLGAINDQIELTRLGSILSKFPVPPNFGKAIVLGTVLGIGPIVCEIMSMISLGSPYSTNESEVQTKASVGGTRTSDHITLNKDPTHAEKFASALDLKLPVLALATRVKSQLIETLRASGFPDHLFSENPILNEPSQEVLDLLLAVLTTALYPNVCYVKDKKRVVTIDGSLAIFPNGLEVDHSCLLVFTEKIVSRNSICRESSVISSIALMLFCSRSVRCVGKDHILLDDRFHIEMDANIACKIVSLRPHIESLINNTCNVCLTSDVLSEEEFMLVDLLIELCIT